MRNKILFVASTRDHATTLIPVMIGLRKYEKNEIVVLALGIGAKKKLQEENISYNVPEDYVIKETYEKIDKKARSLTNNWYNQEEIKEALMYQGISLGSLVEYKLTFLFVRIIKSVATINAVIEIERPDRIVLVEDKELVSRTCSLLGKLKNIPVLSIKQSAISSVRSYFLRDSVPVTIGLAGFELSFSIPHSILNYLRYGINLLGKNWIGMERKIHKQRRRESTVQKNKILMLEANIMEYEPLIKALRDDNDLIIINEVKPIGSSFGALRILLENDRPYKSLEDYISKQVRRTINEEARSVVDKRNNIIRTNENFKKMFAFQGIPFWELVEDRFQHLFSKRGSFVKVVRYIEAIKSLIRTERINMIIAFTDVLEFEKTAVVIGNSMGLPTLVLQHGVTGGDIGYVPLTADRMAVWGRISKDWMIRRDTNPDRLFVTGCPKFDLLPQSSVAKEEFRRKLKLIPDKNLIVLATEPFGGDTSIEKEEEPEMLFRIVLEAMREFPEIQFVIKPHPSEDVRFYKAIAKEMKAKVRVTKNVNLYELLSACDILMTGTSTVGLEAMMLGKPVIFMNLTGRSDPVPYAESGAAIGVYKPKEIAPAIRSILEDPQANKNLETHRKKFLPEYVYIKSNGKASKRVANLVKQMIKDNKMTTKPTD